MFKKGLFGLFLALIVLGFGAGSAAAADFEGGDNYTLAAGETTDGDLFVSAQSVLINGNVNGDLFTSGNDITINGNVDGNLFMGGGTMIVNGSVSGDIFGGGQAITINGTADDVRVGGAFVTINGDINDELMVGAGEVDINGTIGGDTYVGTETLRFGESAQIGGQITYTTPEPIAAADRVAASSEHIQNATEEVEESTGSMIFGWFTSTLLAIIGYVAFAWLLFRIAPTMLNRSSGLLDNQLGKSAGFGLIAFLIFPIAVVLLAVIVGLFFGVGGAFAFAFAAFGIAALLWLFSPIIIGYWISGRFAEGGLMGMLVAVAIIALLITLPVVGGILALISFILALGSAILMIANKDDDMPKVAVA